MRLGAAIALALGADRLMAIFISMRALPTAILAMAASDLLAGFYRLLSDAHGIMAGYLAALPLPPHYWPMRDTRFVLLLNGVPLVILLSLQVMRGLLSLLVVVGLAAAYQVLLALLRWPAVHGGRRSLRGWRAAHGRLVGSRDRGGVAVSGRPLLAGEGLRACYAGREIFAALDCAFATGVHALRGENGIGKSTLLRLLAGAQPADAGLVRIDGIDLARAPERAKMRLSYVPDESPIYPFMTGEALLHFVAAAKRTTIDATVDGLVGGFDLAPHLRTRFDAMSLGTRKKMMLCAAWIGAPKVPLLDEPSNGLDLDLRDHLIRLVRHCGRDNAILFAAHDEEFVSACGATVIEMRSLIGASRIELNSRGCSATPP